jgi:hypothetical protein
MASNATWLAALATLRILAGYEVLLAGFDRFGPQDALA